MKPLLLSFALLSLLAGTAHADIDLSFPANTSSDTTVIKTLTGVKGFHEPGDLTTYSLALANNAITLRYNIKMAPGNKPHSATAGLWVPIYKGGDLKDLRRSESIQFEMKSSVANKVKVSIVSALYDAVSSKENATLTSEDQKIGTEFKTYTIATTAFAMPSWYIGCSGDCLTTFWADDGTNRATVEIGKAVDAIVFQPQLDGGWNADGTQLIKYGDADFTIKNIRIVREGIVDPPMGVTCRGSTFYQLDNFASQRSPSLSHEGNCWYAYSDTSSNPAKRNDSATGASSVILPAGINKWAPANGVAAVTASLEKNVTASSFKYHAYAGWAGIGIGFGHPEGVSLDLSAMTAVQFDLYIGQDAANVVTGASWDAKNVPVLNFKTSTAATPDAAPYAIQIPVTQSTQTICVDMNALTQPSWYNERTYGTKTGPAITTDALMKMAWEMKIMDQGDSTIHSSGPNTFAIANIKLFGVDSAYVATPMGALMVTCRDTATNPELCPAVPPPVKPVYPDCASDVGIHKSGHPKTFAVSYNNGLVFGSDIAPTAKIDVLRMDGTTVRAFLASQAASVRLGAGSYLVTIRNGDGTRAVRSLAVVR